MAGQDGSPFADVVRADGLFDEIGRRKVAWHGIEFIGRKKCSGHCWALAKAKRPASSCLTSMELTSAMASGDKLARCRTALTQ